MYKSSFSFSFSFHFFLRMFWWLLRIHFVLLSLVISLPFSEAQGAKDLYDPANSSEAIDLVETPLGVSLLQSAALVFRDNVIQTQFDKEFNTLQQELRTSVEEGKLGYLLKVEMYSDEFGTVVVPDGQLLFPVGIGTEPVDSLAEFIRRPSLTAPPPQGLQNQSYYIWVKKENGKLKAGVIPREFRPQLDKSASEEATRRDLLGQWQRDFPAGGMVQLQRAAYWNEMAQTHIKLIGSEQRQKRVETLVSEFNEAQKRFNEAYKLYGETEAELVRQGERAATLQTISKVAGIVSNAIQIGHIVSTNDNETKMSSSGKPQANLKATLEYTERTENLLTKEQSERKLLIHAEGVNLQKLNNELQKSFNAENIPLPKAEDNFDIPHP